MNPLFSIVIANYNYGRFLEDAIKSVLTQSCQDFELIICDAASTDNSVEIIKKYANGLPPNTSYDEWLLKNNFQLPTSTPQLITWWCSEKDGGQSAAFNKGFSHARGRFLTWLNADDILFPDALAAIEKETRRHLETEWFIGSSMYVDRDLRITRCFRCHRFSRLRARFGFLSVGGPSSFFTKRLLDSVGGIDENLHFLMDIDLWYKFARNRHKTYKRTCSYVFAYRIHEDSKMSGADVEKSEKALSNRAKAQKEFELLQCRYGIPGRLIVRLVTIVTLSILDKVLSIIDTSINKRRICFHA